MRCSPMKNTNSNVEAKIRNLINEGSLVLVIVVLCVFFSIKTPYFLNFKNLMNILVSVSVIGIAAVGFTCTLIASGADLTTGAMMALSSCLSASLVTNTGLPWYAGVLAALGAGLVVGFLNGLLITKFKATPLRWGLRASADLLPQPCSTKNGKYIQYSRIFHTFACVKISRRISLPHYAALP